MTAFCESDKKRILDSLTAEDLTIFKEAFTVYDKGWRGLDFYKDFTQILFRKSFIFIRNCVLI